LAREAIPQPAGSAELVVGDQGMSSDALWVVLLANLFALFSEEQQLAIIIIIAPPRQSRGYTKQSPIKRKKKM
jgi:hypothetical protein